MAAIEDGLYQPTMKARMAELEQMKAETETRLNTAAPALLPDVNPNVAEFYRRKVQQLAATLGDEQTNLEAAEAIRSLIGAVVLTPGQRRGEVNATLSGELMAILDFGTDRNTERNSAPCVTTAAAASPRNHFCYNTCSSHVPRRAFRHGAVFVADWRTVCRPLDRNARACIMFLCRALKTAPSRRTGATASSAIWGCSYCSRCSSIS